MMILGYGEDAFTFHALKYGLGSILRQLGDDSDPAEAVVLFRPSFGRRSTKPDGKPRSEFGEPDALIRTPVATYIVEAKWVASGERQGDTVTLHPRQIRRHRVLGAYIEAWHTWRAKEAGDDWESFRPHAEAALAALAPDVAPAVSVPGAGTTLASSLHFVFRTLDPEHRAVDVLLYCYPEGEPDPGQLSCDGFKVVRYACPTVARSRFVVLDGTPADTAVGADMASGAGA
jgi:hypothetical protein